MLRNYYSSFSGVVKADNDKTGDLYQLQLQHQNIHYLLKSRHNFHLIVEKINLAILRVSLTVKL